jgi:hypothetical protein
MGEQSERKLDEPPSGDQAAHGTYLERHETAG